MSKKPPADPELERLRALLFSREMDLLGRLSPLLDNPRSEAERISHILPDAMMLLSAGDERLNTAMEPLVDKMVRSAMNSNRQEFTDAIFPLMGPSIRKSIAETFRSMLDSFSKSMEMSFSLKGLRWRLEAMRSGKSFSDVVLLHTLVYRVEQIYLIHSATGIDLAHVANEGVDAQDASMVSAMLTAIQDFVQDCIAKGKEGNLESMQHGEHIFLVEKHPLAYLACIVRGTPPVDFRANMRVCLEHVVVGYGNLLESFDGDTAPFAGCVPILEKLLQARYVDEDKPTPLWSKALLILLLLSAAGGFAFYRWTKWQEAEMREEAINLLRGEPGLAIFHVEIENQGPWRVFGLKDELARDPAQVLQGKDIDPSVFAFRMLPFVSHDPDMVRRRVDAAILPPEGASFSLHDGVLRLAGTASVEWILETRNKALLLPGIREVDVRGIADPRVETINAMTRLVEGTVVEFPSGKDIPLPNDQQKLNEAMDTLVQIERLASNMGLSVGLTIYGHADATGSERKNYELSQSRARTIAAMLYSRGSTMPVSLYGLGADYANRSGPRQDQASRRIEMRIHLSRRLTNPSLLKP